MDGQQTSLLKAVGLSAPCRASECFEKWKRFIEKESLEEYSEGVNIEHLRDHFEQGDAEVTVEYWGRKSKTEHICIRQSFFMTRDDETGDIMVMVVSKEISRSAWA